MKDAIKIYPAIGGGFRTHLMLGGAGYDAHGQGTPAAVAALGGGGENQRRRSTLFPLAARALQKRVEEPIPRKTNDGGGTTATAKPPTPTGPSAADLRKQGDDYFKAKQYAEAATAYQRLVRVSPDDEEAWFDLGNAYYNTERYTEAVTAYQKATELSPQWETAHFYLGDAYSQLQRYKDAATSYIEAVNNPTTGSVRALGET